MNLPQVSGGGGGIELAAGQTFATASNAAGAGIGTFGVSGININTTNTILSMAGKFRVQDLQLGGLGTSGTLALTIVIDGRTIFSGNLTITADALNIFGISGSRNVDSIKIRSSLVITGQKTGVTASASGKIFAEL